MRPCGCRASDRKDAECRATAVAAAKAEHGPAVGIPREHGLRLRGQPVEPPSHVRRAAGEVDARAGRRAEHQLSVVPQAR